MFGKSALQRMTMTSMQSRGFAVNEKAVKIRMNSVKSIKQITGAMKMVSAAKMRGDMRRLEGGKNFGIAAVDMMIKADGYMEKRRYRLSDNPKEFIVPVTSDKGLCGSTNSGVIRSLKHYAKNKDRTKLTMFAVGDKGTAGLARPFSDCLVGGMTNITAPLNYPTAMAVSEQVMKHSTEADVIKIIYNEYVSAIATNVRYLELMPRHHFLNMFKFGKLYNQEAPDANTSNQVLYELYLTSNIYCALLNNAASEQSNRMAAMENASKNAGELLDSLSLVYNKARQARITTELVEIISGISALE